METPGETNREDLNRLPNDPCRRKDQIMTSRTWCWPQTQMLEKFWGKRDQLG